MKEPMGSSLRHFDFNFRLPSNSLFLCFVNAFLETKIRILEAAGVFRHHEYCILKALSDRLEVRVAGDPGAPKLPGPWRGGRGSCRQVRLGRCGQIKVTLFDRLSQSVR